MSNTTSYTKIIKRANDDGTLTTYTQKEINLAKKMKIDLYRVDNPSGYQKFLSYILNGNHISDSFGKTIIPDEIICKIRPQHLIHYTSQKRSCPPFEGNSKNFPDIIEKKISECKKRSQKYQLQTQYDNINGEDLGLLSTSMPDKPIAKKRKQWLYEWTEAIEAYKNNPNFHTRHRKEAIAKQEPQSNEAPTITNQRLFDCYGELSHDSPFPSTTLDDS